MSIKNHCDFSGKIRNMIRNFKSAVAFLESLIPYGQSQKYPGERGLLRQKYLLKLLGNPQDQYPCIHVTGTAGKGSTCYLISSILKEAGYKVGLHVSPHLQSITERAQINNENISKKKFVELVKLIAPAVRKVSKNPKFGSPTYFEVLVALTFLGFLKEKVDLAVIEVGMGGKLDGTNVIKKPLISIIANVGLDHIKILGGTVEQIINDKKEIIKNGSTVISGVWQTTVKKIIFDKCKSKKSRLLLLGRDFNYRFKRMDATGEIFDFISKDKKYKNLKLGLLGLHQIGNASLALMAVEQIKKAGFKIKEVDIRKALRKAFFAGRLEVIKKKPLLVFDGAHNEDKVEALINSFPKLFSYKKLIVVFALKKDKDLEKILPLIINIASQIIITRFTVGTDLGLNLSYPQEEIKQMLETRFGFKNTEVYSDPQKALARALSLQKKDDAILVTGSLYLVGQLKNIIEKAI